MKRALLSLGILLIGVLTLLVYAGTLAGSTHVWSGLAFLLFGYAVGAYGTMVGAGGGFLIVPMMLLVYHATPAQSAGTGLAVVFLNAVSGTLSYAHQKRIDYRAGLLFAVATLPGAISGAFLARLFSGHTFNIV